MDHLGDLLAPERVRSGLTVPNKKMLLQQLGQLSAETLGLPALAVTERLLAREKLGSTGFGGGAAIPHGRIPGITAVSGIFVRLAQAIDYGAVDGAPVDLVFLLLSPESGSAKHLKALARVSRQLRDAGFAAKLRGAGSQDALFALLVPVEVCGAA